MELEMELERPSTEEIKQVFFATMMAKYTGDGCEKTTVTESPGFKSVNNNIGISPRFNVIDTHITTPHSDMSSGMTVIFYDGLPVWDMHYGGAYTKKVIPFLKKALLANYTRNVFMAGRGFFGYTDELYTYYNIIHANDSGFENFKTEERVCETHTNKTLGYHWVHGGSLLKNQNFLI